MFICIQLRLNLDFCFQLRNIYTFFCLSHNKRCGWSPGSIWELQIWLITRRNVLYSRSFLYASFHCSDQLFDFLLVNWNLQNLDAVLHFQQYSREVFVFPQINLNSQEYSVGKALPPQICSRRFFILCLEIYIRVHVALFSVSQ